MEKAELNGKMKDYQSSFIKKPDSPPARYGKSLYIREKHHERVSQIINLIGKREITLYDYVDNVLTEHFKRFHEEILCSFDGRRIY